MFEVPGQNNENEVVNPYTGLQSLCQNVWNTQNLTIMTFGDKLAKVNLDSENIDEIQLANLIFLAFKLEVPTLNTKWWFLHAHDFKEIAKNNKIIWILNEEKLEISNNLQISNRCWTHWIFVLYTIMWQIQSLKLQSRNQNLI